MASTAMIARSVGRISCFDALARAKVLRATTRAPRGRLQNGGLGLRRQRAMNLAAARMFVGAS